MRWYDLEPDVCMAISMIEMTNAETRTVCGEFIIEQIKALDTEYTFVRNMTIENINRGYTRWYDMDDQLSMAFKYLKATTKYVQKEVSLAILAFLKSDCAIC